MPIASIVLSFPQIGIFDKVSITLDGLPGVGIASGKNLSLDLALIYLGSKSALRGILTSSGSPKK